MLCTRHLLVHVQCSSVRGQLSLLLPLAGVFGVVYDGYLSNAEDDPEGAIPVIIKTVKGEAFSLSLMICQSSREGSREKVPETATAVQRQSRGQPAC